LDEVAKLTTEKMFVALNRGAVLRGEDLGKSLSRWAEFIGPLPLEFQGVKEDGGVLLYVGQKDLEDLFIFIKQGDRWKLDECYLHW